MRREKVYLCLDLKSFYASVECVERGLDPLKADLVVADPERTEKTICLAVSPHLKAQGVRNRCRVFEIPPNLSYIMAPPRMQLYMDYSARIYGIYLKYAAEEDIHVYSIDEVFIDASAYLGARRQTPLDFARMIMGDVLQATGISATCGIGSNLYLAKIAMDIISKRTKERIGILTEESYRELLWDHLPLTDFWRVSHGTVNRLAHLGIRTMRDLAHADEAILYKSFGIDAELLIDHAWGRESTGLADIKAYQPRSSSLSSGQVLSCGYDYAGTLLLVQEMAELLSLDLVEAGLKTSAIALSLGRGHSEDAPSAHGSICLDAPTSSTKRILRYTEELYSRIADRELLTYHINIVFYKIKTDDGLQFDLFSDPTELERERRMQRAMVSIKQKYGRNGVFKGMNLLEGAKTRERNAQIGGHRA